MDDHQLIDTDDGQKLILKVYGNAINADDLPKLDDVLGKTSLSGTLIEIISTSEINLEQIKMLETRVSEINNISEKLTAVEKEKANINVKIREMEEQFSSSKIDSVTLLELGKELKTLYPDILRVDFGNIQSTDFKQVVDGLPSFIVSWEKNKRIDRKERIQLRAFLTERLDLDTLQVLHKP